jgi:hypothetical protein
MAKKTAKVAPKTAKPAAAAAPQAAPHAASKSWTSLQDVGVDAKDALAAAGKNAFAGMLAFNTEVLDFTQKLFNDRIVTLKSAMDAKSVKDVLDAETQFAKRTYTSTMDYVRTLGSVAQKAAVDTVTPIRTTVADYVSKKAA